MNKPNQINQMKQNRILGTSFAAKLFLSAFLLVFAYSCDTDQDVAKPQDDPSLAKHIQFLTETTGYKKSVILFDKPNDRFIIDNDVVISRVAVEDYMAGKHLLHNKSGKSEQRRWTYLVSDTYVFNIKYFLEASTPAEWRPHITQAIAEWNAVGSSKIRLSETTNSSIANIRVNSMFEDANWVARAELPYADGTPGHVLTINTKFNGMSASEKLFAMVHEMGHNIGFLHTNQTDGAIIPGTPETDPNSVMNSFVLPWNGFTNYDRIALRQLYPASGVASVYLDCNFTGTAATLGVGDYTLGTLMSRGIGNDAISSLRVSSGYEVILYEHDNFAGWARTYIGDDGCLVDDGINDQASSLRVRARTSFSLLVQAEAYNAMAGVQTEATTDAGGGLNVGWIDNADWMSYFNINIPTSGTYRVEYRVASPNASRQLSLDLNGGAVVLGVVTIPNTGGWQNWTTISHTVNINAGTYNFGIYAPSGGWNINWWRITKI
jgi:hypothetical protein